MYLILNQMYLIKKKFFLIKKELKKEKNLCGWECRFFVSDVISGL